MIMLSRALSFFLVVLFTPPVLLAGDFLQPGAPSGGIIEAGSESGALAQNNQRFNFGGGGQVAASTPASMFAPQSDCQAYVQQAVGVVVMNESTTIPVSLYHCIQEHFASIMGGLAIGFQTIGDFENAKKTMLIARDTLVAGNRDGHRTAKALGIPIAAAPDESDVTRYVAGGPLNYHVIATPGAPQKAPYIPKTGYQPPPPVDPLLDEYHKREMGK